MRTKEPSPMRLTRLVVVYTLARLAVVATCAGAAVLGVRLFGLAVSQSWALVVGLLAGMAVAMVALRGLRRRVHDEIVVVDTRRGHRR
ncbi:conserved exported hypothetical protein [Rhodococcus ruber]|uniref:Uncharacterized protein n=2 Tax=Nocardiaceae TaxID=85025 RepID=A0A098BMY4_9NOCA|nr:hypothetical protein YT1_0301 [Rhodococcus ruber]RQM33067.1 hypothetical protein TN91_16915 [Rhodococcus ruber]CDZ90084.1 conserved exported hypothetical protein [Rhodococcus ruber]